MKYKIWLPFLLILGLPILALCYMGIKLAREEQKTLKSQYDELLAERLRDLQQETRHYFTKKRSQLQARLDSFPRTAASLQSALSASPLVKRYFAVDRRGQVVFPPGDTANPGAAAFFSSLPEAIVWSKAAELPGVQAGNWLSAAAEGERRLFYYGIGASQIEVLELDLEHFLEGLQNYIGRSSGTTLNNRAQLVMMDERQNPQQRWGNPPQRLSELPARVVELADPLKGWQLAYFVPKGLWYHPLGEAALFNALSGTILLITTLLTLAFYFYREHSRQLGEAQLRVNFVSQVSHELKTPLTNIRMYAELLERLLEEDADHERSHVRVIVAESQRLSRLIGNILTFGKRDKDKLTLRLAPARVLDIVQDVLDNFRPSLEELGIRVECEFEDQVEVLLDRDAFQQILGNLISNVEKYAADGGVLKIDCRREGVFSIVVVADHGAGIIKNQREHIFQPFSRLSNRITEGASGTGIGLSISRDLARLHGGDLELLDSERGAVFKVVLKTPVALNSDALSQGLQLIN